MALLPILTFPDSRLREISVPVEKVTPEYVQLAHDMLETMYEAHGIGLAAPQVNHLIRLIVIDIRRPLNEPTPEGEKDIYTELEMKVSFPLVLFNPVVVRGEGKNTYEEGCLSVPGFNETVERYNFVEVSALGLNNEKIKIETDGLLAICIQHEMDHLEGKLFIDRISMLKSNRIKAKIKKSGYPPRQNRSSDKETKLDMKSKKLDKSLV